MLQRIPEGLKGVNYFDSIESRLANYEHLQNVAPILELALWKSEGQAIIIPNVLSFL
jgi:hypothetical protein